MTLEEDFNSNLERWLNHCSQFAHDSNVKRSLDHESFNTLVGLGKEIFPLLYTATLKADEASPLRLVIQPLIKEIAGNSYDIPHELKGNVDYMWIHSQNWLHNSDKKIVMVDDEKEILATMGDYLARQGYEVSERYDNPSEALDKLKESPSTDYRLFMFNYLMPGMNGVDLSRKVMLETPHAGVPIVLYSGCSEIEVRNQTSPWPDNIADFFSMPCDPEELSDTIKRNMDVYQFI